MVRCWAAETQPLTWQLYVEEESTHSSKSYFCVQKGLFPSPGGSSAPSFVKRVLS